MAILWCGAEDVDFPNGSSAVVDTGSTHFRSGYARYSLKLPSTNGYVSTPFPGGAVASAWLSFRAYLSSTPSSLYLLGFTDATAANALYVFVNPSTGKVSLSKWVGGSGTALATETGTSLPISNLKKVDMQVVNYGASATVRIYVDAALVVEYSGDISLTGVTGFDRIRSGSAAANAYYVSEIIVADEDTRTMSLVTMAPSAEGTTDQWTGAYTDVNENAFNDATVAYTNAASQDEQFNLIDLPSGSFAIRALKIAARASSTADATATKVALGLNNGGSIDAGAPQTMSTAFATYERLITSSLPAASAMNALQVNLRSGS